LKIANIWERRPGPIGANKSVLSESKTMFVSRNEKDKLDYNYVIRNILCPNNENPEQRQEDSKIYDTLREYYKDEYPKIVKILENYMTFDNPDEKTKFRESIEFGISDKITYGARRSESYCKSFYKSNPLFTDANVNSTEELVDKIRRQGQPVT